MSNTVDLPGTVGVTKLYNKALSDLDVDKLARNAGVKDQPPSHATSPDANEREFVSYFANQLRSRKEQCEKLLAQARVDRISTSSKIDIEQTRASLAGLLEVAPFV